MADEKGSAQAKTGGDAELFDVVIPPGVPRKLIIEISQKFDVEVVESLQKLYFANMEGDERNLLAFRAKRDVAEKVEKYMIDEVRKYIGS